MTRAKIACGSRLDGTDYIFTNLGGRYRIFAADSPYGDAQIATFTRWDDMWDWVRENPTPPVKA